MLKVIREESKAKKTRIYHKAYIDWDHFNKHFDFLLKENFICCVDGENFELTDDGSELLKILDELKRALNKNADSEILIPP